MKKLFLLAIAGCSLTGAIAQDSVKLKSLNQNMPRWCIDVNYKEGLLSYDMGNMVLPTIYSQAIADSSKISNIKLANSHSRGIDVSLGYFLGKRKRFGVGLGAMVFSQTGDLSIDNFAVQYQSTNGPGNQPFRQIVKSTGKTTENITMTSINVPLMLKYKHQFNSNLGLNVDLGGLLNVSNTNAYTTNAAFNYEAAYLVNTDGHSIYDNHSAFQAQDWLITQYHIMKTNNDQSITDYFINKANQGYNVGLGVKPKSTTGNASYDAGGYGFFGQLALSYQLTYRFALNLGGYYSYQIFTNSNYQNWKMTDKVGDYTTMVSGIKQNVVTSYGVTIGIRYYLGGFPDRDGDGIADAKDECPNKYGPQLFKGCPDTDGDGISDKEDACPFEPGPACTSGCPDKDGDCIPDSKDRCPDVAGSAEFNGCPDTDGDGMPDEFDHCPDQPGPKDNFGCPTDSVVVSNSVREKIKSMQDNTTVTTTFVPPHVVLSTTVVNFKFGKSEVSKETLLKLEDAVEKLNANPKLILSISGHTDDVGSFANNLVLSWERAKVIGEYMKKHGIAKERIILSGYGNENPVIKNTDEKSRAQNRRIEMKLLLPI